MHGIAKLSTIPPAPYQYILQEQQPPSNSQPKEECKENETKKTSHCKIPFLFAHPVNIPVRGAFFTSKMIVTTRRGLRWVIVRLVSLICELWSLSRTGIVVFRNPSQPRSYLQLESFLAIWASKDLPGHIMPWGEVVLEDRFPFPSNIREN